MIWLLLGGCTTDIPSTDDEQATTSESDTAEGTEFGGGSLALGWLRLRLVFAVDADGVTITDFNLSDSYEVRAALTVGWFPTDKETDTFTGSCWMELSLTGLQITTQEPNPHPFRLDVPPNRPVVENCPGVLFNRSQFPDGDPIRGTFPPDVPWSFEWGGPPADGLKSFFTDEQIATIDEVAGASVSTPLIGEDYANFMAVRAIQIEEGFTVFDDDGPV
ncbi:MAG: hypothetical protein AAGA48_24835, partial [Myxococcota bacterium]